jgi:HK97 family phage major capsid protein
VSEQNKNENEIPTQALDELKSGVATLTQAVADLAKDKIDRETVVQIAEEVVETQAAAVPRRRSVEPSDQVAGELLGKQGAERLQLIQSMPASQVAPLVRRDVEEVAHFQRTCDELLILTAILNRPDGPKVAPQETRFYAQRVKPLAQAMDSSTAGEGLEFIPRELSANLIDRVELAQKVLSLFTSVDMPTQPFDLPGRPVARKKLARGVENTADSGQTLVKKVTPGTRQVTFTAKKFWGEALVSKEAEEDAIVAMLPFIVSELERYMRYDLEDAGVNGDTAGALDTAAGFYAADDPLLNWDGLRKLAPAAAKTDGGNAKLTASMLRANRKVMGKYGVDPLELAHILSVNAYIDLLDDSSLLTLEKYGPNATILTGELGKVDNIPVVVSEAVHADLNAAGVFDNVTKTRTEAISVYRPGFGVGERRGLTIEILRELYSEADQDAVKISVRRALSPFYPTATEPIVALTYNLKN